MRVTLTISVRASLFYVLPLALTCQSVPPAEVGQPVLPAFEFTQVHMGMPVRLVLHAPDAGAVRQAAVAAFARIAALDQMMSDYRADSELRRLDARPEVWIPVSAELFTVLARAAEISETTHGAFDVSVAPLVALWREARTTRRLPDKPRLEAARSLVGWRHVQLDPSRRAVRLAKRGMRLDLGGIAKGYILEEARRTLVTHGITRVLLESGGDIVVGDPPPGRPGWQIDAPSASPAFVERAARLSNAALATSGATAQSVEIDGVRYSHIIDPRTGLGVTDPTVARVIAEDAATADGLATALTILGQEAVAALSARFRGVHIDLTTSR
jgi:FAD:protein FMN transferase